MQRILCYLVLLFVYCVSMHADLIYYPDNERHLIFMLDPSTKEAMVGTGEYGETTAFLHPDYINNPNASTAGWWTNIVIPSHVTYGGETYVVTQIARYAFYRSATTIKTVELPETIESIGESAFGWCTGLTSINIPNQVKVLPTGVFELCIELNDVNIPSQVTSIGYMAFFNCSKLKSVTIPATCTSIGDDAFTWCHKLEELILEDGLDTLHVGYSYEKGYDYELVYDKAFWRPIFNDCPLRKLHVGRNINYPTLPKYGKMSPFSYLARIGYDVESNPVYHPSGKTYNVLTFGNHIEIIPEGYFSRAGIPNLVLPKNIKEICSGAFDQSLGQNELTIPSGCKKIHDGAFSNCRFKFIHSLATTPPEIHYPGWGSDILVSVPSGCGASYRNAEGWKYYITKDPSDAIVSVDVKYPGSLYGRLAYQDLTATDVYRLKLTGNLNNDDWEVINTMTNLYELDLSKIEVDTLTQIKSRLPFLSSIKFPQVLKYIDDGAFSNSLLQQDTLIIPASCRLIGQSAFGHTNVRHVEINGSTIIKEYAFGYCKRLRTFNAKGENIVLENKAFQSSALQKVDMGSRGVIRNDAFYYCDSLEEIVFQDGVDSIYENAFQAIPLKKITMNGCIKHIGENAFIASKESLEEFYLTNIDRWCANSFIRPETNPMTYAKEIFINGEKAKTLSIPDNIQTIGNYAFANCVGIQYLELPTSLKKIGIGSFAGCNTIESVLIPQSIEIIDKYAFSNCSSLSGIKLPKNLQVISQGCFANCTSLKEVSLPSKLNTIEGCAFSFCKQLSDISLPSSIKTIADSAFFACDSIKSLSLPFRLSNIGTCAFAKCTNLKTITAKWLEPIKINTNTFDNISSKCCLWVPFNSATKYYAAGYGHISLIEEGFYVLLADVGRGGSITYDNITLSNNLDAFAIQPDVDSIILDIDLYDDNTYATLITLNDSDITDSVLDNHISIYGIDNHMTLSIEFGRYVLGDVNNDDYIDVGDIFAVVKYIQEQPDSKFVAIAADANMDDDIDVGDITAIVDLIIAEGNRSPISKRTINSTIPLMYDFYANTYVFTNSHTQQDVAVYLDYEGDITGFQCELIVPEGFTIPQDTLGNYMIKLNPNRVSNMNIKEILRLSDQRYQILCSSTNKALLTDNNGEIMQISLVAASNLLPNDYYLSINDIRVSDDNANVSRTETDVLLRFENTGTNVLENRTTLMQNSKYLDKGHLIIIKDGIRYNVLGIKLDKKM